MAELFDVVVLVIITTGVMTGLLLLGDDIANKYNVNLTTETNTTDGLNRTNIDNVDEIYENIQEATDSLVSKDTTDENAASEMLVGAFSSVRIFLKAPSIAKDMLDVVATALHIHPIVIKVVMGIILAIVAFAVIRAIFRVQ